MAGGRIGANFEGAESESLELGGSLGGTQRTSVARVQEQISAFVLAETFALYIMRREKCARRGSNPQPSASEADTLSN